MKKFGRRALAVCLAMLLVLGAAPVDMLAVPVSAARTSVEINETNFPDANFRNDVKTYDINNDGVLNENEKIYRLLLSYKSISSLKGIEFLTELTYLQCDHNQLTSLDVSKNTALTDLSCGYNQLTAIDVSKNTELTDLGVENNQLTTLDVSRNTKLQDLYCANNKLTSLDLSKNTSLELLSCRSNPLETISFANNTRPKTFYHDCKEEVMPGQEAQDPTCTEAGHTAGTKCAFCGKTYSPETIPATGHTLTKTEGVEATCTEAGTAAYWTCSVCNKKYSDEEATTEITDTTIPATGHSFSTAWESNQTHHWHTCTACGVKSDEATHTWIDGTCTTCHLDLSTFGVVLNQATATLEGDIGLNYYIELPQSVIDDAGAYVQFTVNGESKQIPVSSITPDNGMYKFTYRMNAKEMHDTVTFEVYSKGSPVDIYDKNGNTAKSFNYTLAEYFQTLITDHSENKALVNLAKATLAYGSYAQIALDHHTDTAGTLDDVSDVTAEILEAYKITKSGEVPAGITLRQMTLVLETETAFRVYFTAENLGDHSFTLDGAKVQPKEKDGMYYIELTNIAAKDLGAGHTLAIDDQCTLKFSALSYAYAVVQDGTDANTCDAVKALYKYNQAAKAYFNKEAQA